MLSMIHSTDGPPRDLGSRHHHVPPGTGTFGMALFLAALGMLFGSSLLGYVLIRYQSHRAPEMGVLDLPLGLWASTALILLSSFTIHLAMQNLRRERQARFRNAMVLTLLLAAGFLVVQIPSLVTLLRDHFQMIDAEDGFQLYGLMFTFILVHALHVLGGLIPLVITTVKAQAGRYDHEHYAPVLQLAMYWHFLDVVWVLMFAVFLVAA